MLSGMFAVICLIMATKERTIMAKEVAENPVIKPAEPKPARPLRSLPRPAFKLRESVNNRWRAVAPADTPRSQFTTSDLYRQIAGDLLPYDKIIMIADDNTWYCELLVVDCGTGHASLVELLFRELPRMIVADDGLPPNHEIFHGGPDTLWCIRRVGDNVMMGTGFPNRHEAVQFLLDHASLR